MNFYGIISTKNCGHRQLIDIALNYLPRDIQILVLETTKIVTMYDRYGFCLPQTNRRVIIISEIYIPKSGIVAKTMYYRWFIHTVLHEVAHAVLHEEFAPEGTPEADKQEKEAHKQAIDWYNEFATSKGCEENRQPLIDDFESELKKRITKIRAYSDGLLKELRCY